MKELKIRKRTTNIQEDTRRTLDITRDEYAFCGYVQYRQAYPEQKKRGFCCDGKDELAYFVGISRAGLYKMIDRLSLSGLLDIEATTGYLSVTKKWIDADSDCKQSRQPQKNSVNLVDTDCKLSLQDGVNLVTGNIEVQLENKLEQEENSAAEKTAASLPENPSLEANPLKKEKPPVAQPPLDLSGCYKHFSDPAKIRVLWERWMKYRKDLKKPLKTEDTIITALRSLYKWSEGNVATATEIVEKSIGNQWQGLIKPEQPRQAAPNTSQPYKLEPVPERTSAPAYTP